MSLVFKLPNQKTRLANQREAEIISFYDTAADRENNTRDLEEYLIMHKSYSSESLAIVQHYLLTVCTFKSWKNHRKLNCRYISKLHSPNYL